jgi:hypothetical protein
MASYLLLRIPAQESRWAMDNNSAKYDKHTPTQYSGAMNIKESSSANVWDYLSSEKIGFDKLTF